MGAFILKAKAFVEHETPGLKKAAQEFHTRSGRPARLDVIWVGDNEASAVYVNKKARVAKELGMTSEIHHFPSTATVAEVRSRVVTLNADPTVDGILIQRPLPKHFNEHEVLYWVSPEKDVDGLHPENLGALVSGLPCLVACTPMGVMELLKYENISMAGKICAVIGRSRIVGKPMAALIQNADGTVLQLHTKTPNAPAICRQADIVIAAAGVAGLVTAEWIKPGAVVVDVGIHRTPEGKLVGDVDAAFVAEIASVLTPVPGGVGPMTIHRLMKNCLWAANNRIANY